MTANTGAITTLQGQVTTNTAALTTLDTRVTTAETNIAGNTAAINALAGSIGNGTVGLVQQANATAPVTVAAASGGTRVDFTGTAGARQLAGVANGQIAAGSTEAVNGGQIHAGNSSIAAALGGGAAVNPDGTLAAPSYLIQGAARTNVGDALAALDTQTTDNTDDITNLDQRVTANTTDIANNGSAIAALSNGTLGLVQQAGPGAVITVAANSGGTVVSFAGTAGDRQLTGVAPGRGERDLQPCGEWKPAPRCEPERGQCAWRRRERRCQWRGDGAIL